MREVSKALVSMLDFVSSMRLEMGQGFESGEWAFRLLGEGEVEGEACRIVEFLPSYAETGEFWLRPDGSVARAKIGGEEVPLARAEHALENHLGPFVAYYDILHSEPLQKRERLDKSAGSVKRLGKKKFKLGKVKLEAWGYRYSPASSAAAPHPMRRVEFWIARVGDLDLLVSYEAEMWVEPRRFWIALKEIEPRV